MTRAGFQRHSLVGIARISAQCQPIARWKQEEIVLWPAVMLRNDISKNVSRIMSPRFYMNSQYVRYSRRKAQLAIPGGGLFIEVKEADFAFPRWITSVVSFNTFICHHVQMRSWNNASKSPKSTAAVLSIPASCSDPIPNLSELILLTRSVTLSFGMSFTKQSIIQIFETTYPLPI